MRHTPQAATTALTLEPASARSRAIFFALCVVLPLAITGCAMAFAAAAGDSDIAPAGKGGAWHGAGRVLAGVAAVTLLLWFACDRLVQRHRLQLRDDGIAIATTFYSRRFTFDELQLDAARVIDLREQTGLRPRFKLNGVDMPGFHSGGFRLRDGRNAFVAMAAGPRVLWLPTRAGRQLLLEVQQPQIALDALRHAADTARRAR